MNEEKKINTSSLELEQETAYVKSNQKKKSISVSLIFQGILYIYRLKILGQIVYKLMD